MKKIISSLIAVLAILTTSLSQSAIINVALGTLNECPQVGFSTSCAAVYQFNANGTVDTLVDSSVRSTDGIEDTLVGIRNNSGQNIDKLTLDGNSLGIFGFDGDGKSDIPNPGTGPGNTYFGQYFDSSLNLLGTVTFNRINTTLGDILFAGLTNGGTGWFVLEEQINFAQPPTPVQTANTPIPGALGLFAFGITWLFGLIRKKES